MRAHNFFALSLRGLGKFIGKTFDLFRWLKAGSQVLVVFFFFVLRVAPNDLDSRFTPARDSLLRSPGTSVHDQDVPLGLRQHRGS